MEHFIKLHGLHLVYLPAADESSLLTILGLFLESFLGWGGFNTIERSSCEQPHFLVYAPITSFTEVTILLEGINLKAIYYVVSHTTHNLDEQIKG